MANVHDSDQMQTTMGDAEVQTTMGTDLSTLRSLRWHWEEASEVDGDLLHCRSVQRKIDDACPCCFETLDSAVNVIKDFYADQLR